MKPVAPVMAMTAPRAPLKVYAPTGFYSDNVLSGYLATRDAILQAIHAQPEQDRPMLQFMYTNLAYKFFF